MKIIKPRLVATLLAAVALCGCETFSVRSHHRATSVIKFLYPRDAQHVETPAIPVLSLR